MNLGVTSSLRQLLLENRLTAAGFVGVVLFLAISSKR